MPRDLAAHSARLATQFAAANQAVLSLLDARIEHQYDGSRVNLVIRSATTIGAVPLVSPTSGRPEYGLVVQPRFEWRGLGVMLSEMGWRTVPSPLTLPMLPESDRKLPAWVLSTIVLFRLQRMLDRLERRFEVTEEIRLAPRGTVDWTTYATREVAHARFLDVPCRFPDLRDDRRLKSAIRFVLQKQLSSLAGQRTAGVYVLRLIEICSALIERVRDVPARSPNPLEITSWFRGALKTSAFQAGLEAIQWSVDDRGLAGLSDLQGLPWAMSMDAFFESWSECVLAETARRIGGVLRAGRIRQTIVPLSWEPPYAGSQKYLLPDLVLERGDVTIIVDAKYKEHWEEMQESTWSSIDEEIRARHRNDLLQVLSYANLSFTPRIVVCLAYPCTGTTWSSLIARGRVFHHASLAAGDRRIELVLTAFPMGTPVQRVAEQFAKTIVQVTS